MRDYEKAGQYYSEALELRIGTGDKNYIASSYINNALIDKNTNRFNEALANYNNALEIYQEIGDKKNTAATYNHIGRLYKKERNIAKAKEFFTKAYNDRVKIDDKSGIAYTSLDLANLYIQDNNMANARPFLETAYKHARQLNNKNLLKDVCLAYSNYYSILRKYKESLDFFKQYSMLKDQILDLESVKKIADMQIRYETEKIEKEKEWLNKENRLQELEIQQQKAMINRQYLIIASIVIVLLIILIFSTILFRQNAKIKKANELLALSNAEIKQQKEEIESQRDEIEAQRDLATQQRDQIEKQNIRITDSIEYASRIQSAILPPDDFIREILPEHFIFYRPRDIVSGDFYWLTKKENYTVVAAVDCTGHGVPGAFMSMLGVALLNEIINKDDLSDASEVLQKLKEKVIKSLHQTGDPDEAADGMDIALSIIDFDAKKMRFAGANNPLYIIRDGEFNEIKADKIPLGIHFIEDEVFTNHEIELQSNDLLYMFSDGYIDQFGGGEMRKLLAKNFKKALLQYYDKPMPEQKDLLDAFIREWMGEQRQIDDMLIIGIKVD